MRPAPCSAARAIGAFALFALAVASLAGCADAREDARANDAPEPREMSELRSELGELDARVTAIEGRLAAIAAALGVAELGDLGEEIALLSEQIDELANPSAASVGIDPLFCIDPSHPQYDSAQFDVYVQEIPICGFLP